MSDKKLPQEPAPKQRNAEEGSKLSPSAFQNHEPGGVGANKRPADKKDSAEGSKSLGKIPSVSNDGPSRKDNVKDPFSRDLPLEEDDEMDDDMAETLAIIRQSCEEQGMTEEQIVDYIAGLFEDNDSEEESDEQDEITDDVSDEDETVSEDDETVSDEQDEITDDVSDEDVEDLEITEEHITTAINEAIADAVTFKLDGSELGNLLEAEENLSGEFKEKAVTVFEAAVTATASAHVAKIVEAATNAAMLAVEQIKADLTANVQEELAQNIAEWKEENKVALQQNARLQIAESFMIGLKDLLETHYIELPEEKQDVFEDVCAENESLSESLKDSIEANERLAEEVAGLRKQLAVEQFVAGMTDLKAEKIRALAEGIAFEGDEDFGSKLKTLNENYFTDKKPAAKGDAVADEFLTEDEQQSTKPKNEVDMVADWINKNF